jgi:hypothetical protein
MCSNISDVSFIPIPMALEKDFPALIYIELPKNIKEGQLFYMEIRQYLYHGIFLKEFFGVFRISIPVSNRKVMLPEEVRRLALLRYMYSSIPVDDPWYLVFTRYIRQVVSRVKDLGGDPTTIPPSIDDPTEDCFTGKVCHITYNKNGDLESFIVKNKHKEHIFNNSEKGIECIIRDAFDKCLTITVCKVGSNVNHVSIECDNDDT